MSEKQIQNIESWFEKISKDNFDEKVSYLKDVLGKAEGMKDKEAIKKIADLAKILKEYKETKDLSSNQRAEFKDLMNEILDVKKSILDDTTNDTLSLENDIIKKDSFNEVIIWENKINFIFNGQKITIWNSDEGYHLDPTWIWGKNRTHDFSVSSFKEDFDRIGEWEEIDILRDIEWTENEYKQKDREVLFRVKKQDGKMVIYDVENKILEESYNKQLEKLSRQEKFSGIESVLVDTQIRNEIKLAIDSKWDIARERLNGLLSKSDNKKVAELSWVGGQNFYNRVHSNVELVRQINEEFKKVSTDLNAFKISILDYLQNDKNVKDIKSESIEEKNNLKEEVKQLASDTAKKVIEKNNLSTEDTFKVEWLLLKGWNAFIDLWDSGSVWLSKKITLTNKNGESIDIIVWVWHNSEFGTWLWVAIWKGWKIGDFDVYGQIWVVWWSLSLSTDLDNHKRVWITWWKIFEWWHFWGVVVEENRAEKMNDELKNISDYVKVKSVSYNEKWLVSNVDLEVSDKLSPSTLEKFWVARENTSGIDTLGDMYKNTADKMKENFIKNINELIVEYPELVEFYGDSEGFIDAIINKTISKEHINSEWWEWNWIGIGWLVTPIYSGPAITINFSKTENIKVSDSDSVKEASVATRKFSDSTNLIYLDKDGKSIDLDATRESLQKKYEDSEINISFYNAWVDLVYNEGNISTNTGDTKIKQSAVLSGSVVNVIYLAYKNEEDILNLNELDEDKLIRIWKGEEVIGSSFSNIDKINDQIKEKSFELKEYLQLDKVITDDVIEEFTKIKYEKNWSKQSRLVYEILENIHKNNIDFVLIKLQALANINPKFELLSLSIDKIVNKEGRFSDSFYREGALNYIKNKIADSLAYTHNVLSSNKMSDKDWLKMTLPKVDMTYKGNKDLQVKWWEEVAKQAWILEKDWKTVAFDKFDWVQRYLLQREILTYGKSEGVFLKPRYEWLMTQLKESWFNSDIFSKEDYIRMISSESFWNVVTEPVMMWYSVHNYSKALESEQGLYVLTGMSDFNQVEKIDNISKENQEVFFENLKTDKELDFIETQFTEILLARKPDINKENISEIFNTLISEGSYLWNAINIDLWVTFYRWITRAWDISIFAKSLSVIFNGEKQDFILAGSNASSIINTYKANTIDTAGISLSDMKDKRTQKIIPKSDPDPDPDPVTPWDGTSNQWWGWWAWSWDGWSQNTSWDWLL